MKLILLLIGIKTLLVWFLHEPMDDEEWHDVYMDSNLNHGQGRKNDEKRY